MFTILFTTIKTKNKECISVYLSREEAKLEMQLLAAEIINELSSRESSIFNVVNDSTLKIYTKQKTSGWFSDSTNDVCLYVLEVIPFRKTSSIVMNSVHTQTSHPLVCESSKNTQTELTESTHKATKNQEESLMFIDQLRAKLG